jgi:hypothetical protein
VAHRQSCIGSRRRDASQHHPATYNQLNQHFVDDGDYELAGPSHQALMRSRALWHARSGNRRIHSQVDERSNQDILVRLRTS